MICIRSNVKTFDGKVSFCFPLKGKRFIVSGEHCSEGHIQVVYLTRKFPLTLKYVFYMATRIQYALSGKSVTFALSLFKMQISIT